MTPVLVELTDREEEVLALVEAGLGYRQIAHQLSCTPRTVRRHQEHILGKLNAGTLAQAVSIYVRLKVGLA